jgi:DNA helicase-2/ATP-dependent DNA helicase PcrA
VPATAPRADAAIDPIVAAEEGHLQATLVRLGVPPPEADVDIDAIKQEMERLREQIPTAQEDERPAIILQFERLGHVLAAAGKSRQIGGGVDPNRPYFAHMVLRQDGHERDVFLGNTTRLDHGLRIVDWRHAPISAIYYRYQEGDDFEEEIASSVKEGRLAVRRTLGIAHGSLRRIQCPQGIYLKEDADWTRHDPDAHRLSGGGGEVLRFHQRGALAPAELGAGAARRADKHLPDISALIDKAQFRVLSEEANQLVVIRGVAGSGKTTVALHRLAWLNYQDGNRFRPDRLLVVVWSRAMREFISRLLENLGLKDVHVRSFGEWARELRERHFPSLPHETGDDTPAVVARAKLHPAMLRILEDWVRSHRGAKSTKQAIDDWAHLLTSWETLSRGFGKYAPGAFTDAELKRVVAWTSQQLDRMDEHLHPVERSDDDPEDVAPDHHAERFLDAEDDALLLRLHQLRVGALTFRRDRPLRYTHLVIDEVQDLSPLEVRVLLDCTTSDRSVTLAGDTQQHVLQEAGFASWEDFFSHLGIRGTTVNTLRVSYRSTGPIVDFALRVLGPLREDEAPPSAARDGVPVEVFAFSDHGECIGFVADALRELERREPAASIALIARAPETADLYFAGLKKAGLLRVRRVADQDFAFAPGIEVTDVIQAKGLEFDYVVLIDVSQAAWPDTDAARRQLHVAATRAAHQLWVTAIGEPSPIVREALSP